MTRSRAGELDPSDALLEITGQRTPAAWGAPGMYSVRALPRRPGRSLAVDARAFVGTVDGPLFLLSPRRFPADPPSGGYGAGFASALGAGGNGGRDLRLTAVTPDGAVPLGGYVAENHNYLFTTTLRPSGSYHFVSGGAMGTFPEATLMWVNERGADGSLYAGITAAGRRPGWPPSASSTSGASSRPRTAWPSPSTRSGAAPHRAHRAHRRTWGPRPRGASSGG